MRKFIRFLGYIAIVHIVLGALINVFKGLNSEANQCVDQLIVSDILGAHNHQRQWELNTTNGRFCTTYDTYSADNSRAARHRTDISVKFESSRYPWPELYHELSDVSRPAIRFLTDSLTTISLREDLTRSELAELIVTFVQDIPYSYILPGTCDSFETHGKPCVGNVSLGIYSPYEFIHTLKGDCDTRSVLIYLILQELGFDPIILISDEYAHAMIALNLPTSGDYILSNGEKYYFWETTAKGWPIGMLPPSTGNKDYWKIALRNEL